MGFPFLCDRIRPSASKFFKLIFISNQEYFLASERRRAPPILNHQFSWSFEPLAKVSYLLFSVIPAKAGIQ